MTPGTEDHVAVRWGRIAAVLILAFALFEGFSQIVVVRWAGTAYRSFSNYIWSPYGLVRSNPRLTSPAYRINSNGFREICEYTRIKPPGTVRILILGGSVLYSGLGGTPYPGQPRVASDQTISQFLERRLTSDPELAGCLIEVINAAINYNRYSEVATAYLGEYLDWNPDFVIVGATINSFFTPPRPGDTAKDKSLPQQPHEWRKDFERQANERSLVALGERIRLTLAEHSAFVGILSKGMATTVDRLMSLRDRIAVLPAKAAPELGRDIPEIVDHEEWEQYLRLNLAFAEAMIAAGGARGQRVVFFWEHMLVHLDGIKPFGEKERWLFGHNNVNFPRGPADALNPDRFYTWSRVRFAEELAKRNSRLIDPLEQLRDEAGTVFIDYAHYTAEGNAFMAGVLAKALHDDLVAAVARAAAERKGLCELADSTLPLARDLLRTVSENLHEKLLPNPRH